jgi:hypothetical protein
VSDESPTDPINRSFNVFGGETAASAGGGAGIDGSSVNDVDDEEDDDDENDSRAIWSFTQLCSSGAAEQGGRVWWQNKDYHPNQHYHALIMVQVVLHALFQAYFRSLPLLDVQNQPKHEKHEVTHTKKMP